MASLSAWWNSVTPQELFWLCFGFGAQAMFFMRFVLQWIASEKARQSIVPEVFWYFSFAGGLGLLIYAIHRVDPVIIVGQATGLFIYCRNIYFIWLQKREAREQQSSEIPAE